MCQNLDERAGDIRILILLIFTLCFSTSEAANKLYELVEVVGSLCSLK